LGRFFLLIASVLLLGGCATGAPEGTSGAGERFGFTEVAAWNAVARGEGREALAWYETRAAELERRGSRVPAALAYSAAAHVAEYLGNYQQSIRHGRRALGLLDPDSTSVATLDGLINATVGLGFTYAQVGDFPEARRQFEAGLRVGSRFPFFGPLSAEAGVRQGLAFVAWLEGDRAQAIREGESAIRLAEEFLAKLDTWGLFVPDAKRLRDLAERTRALTLLIIGRVQTELGRLADAERTLDHGAGAAARIGAGEAATIARAMLADVALRRGDHVRGEAEMKTALAESRRLGLTFVSTVALGGLAAAVAAQGRHAEALQAYGEAMRLVEDARNQFEDVGLRSQFLEDKQTIYQGAVLGALALGQIDEALGFAERSRARAFLDLLGNKTTLSKGTTQALAQEEARLRAQIAEARAFAGVQTPLGAQAPGAGGGRAPLEAAERAYREFLGRVRRENREQASLMAVEPITRNEVQAALPEGTTLLEYLVTETELVVWVVDRDRVNALRVPVPRATLVAEARALRQALSEQSPLAAVEAHGRRLYERLVAPIRSFLRNKALLIVPHDVLHYVPFAALRTPEERWLVEDYTLATLPSASVLKYLRHKGADASTRVLVLGNPELGPTLDLQYAEQEARTIGDRYSAATVLTRGEATEAKAKMLARAAGLLHFATHGELSERDPLTSALLLVPGGGEDGRLEVREIFALDLKAWLVVLSACETGLGRLSKGDELVGLQRAFLYAGTPAVITTLWKVDDEASFVLMREFYDRLPRLGPAAALREAQRVTMTRFAHPFAWAAFGLTGTPR
jgi:CHAT domain-containing protein